MIGYVTIGALDVEASLPFWDAVFGAIGGERGFLDGGWAGYGAKGKPNVYICPPHDGQPAKGGNGIMVALLASSIDQVKAARPTRDYDTRYGSRDALTQAVYRSLTAKRGTA